MAATILMIHGRHFKPPEPKLKQLWFDAIRFGLQRDFSAAKVRTFDNAKKSFIYYGDISNKFLKKALNKPPNFNTDDSAGRRKTLNDLKRWQANGFIKRNYNGLPGKSAAGEALADVFGGVASFFRVSDPLIERIGPDLRHYWNFDEQFGSDVRATMTKPLTSALNSRDKVMIISHSLGTMITYDVLWKFSYYSEYQKFWNKKVDLLMTLGSPLADETVKRHLKGARASGERRFPKNIRRWVNFAAEDDYISHDQNVRNDFKDMIRFGLVDSIADHRVYNLAVRNGKSNPHSSAGYLVHPRVVRLIADWL
jgi:hypothetical protein